MAFFIALKTNLRGYSLAEAENLSLSERRRRTSTRVAYVARAVYLSIQLVCIVILLHSESQLGKSWQTPYASYAWSYLALMLVNLLLYTALCMSDPGWLPVKDGNPEAAPLNIDSAAQQAGRDEEAVPACDSYGPLPYATNYANYINLGALGRNNPDTSGSTLPWWELPNPGAHAGLFACIHMLLFVSFHALAHAVLSYGLRCVQDASQM